MAIIEFIEQVPDVHPDLLKNQIIDGYNKTLLFEKMNESLDNKSVESIFSNAYKSLRYFVDPTSSNTNISKILCLGKVQSGKTSFFICSIALAFDNGYDIAYLIGGTKNTLRDQNFERVKDQFQNNPNIVVFDLKYIVYYDVMYEIDRGKKVVIVCLKNTSENTNLGRLDTITQNLSQLKSLVIDDEGDEHTPGAPKRKLRNPRAGVTHDVIVGIINNLACCTFMSVTATPQANLLLSTVDELSPDFLVLVEPGDGYLGGNAFHDTLDNTHTVRINDADDFENSIPDSFKDCFNFFVFACCLMRFRKSSNPFSMLVHPSSLKQIHKIVTERINLYFYSTKNALLDKTNLAHIDCLKNLKKQYFVYCNENETHDLKFEDVIVYLPEVLNNISSIEFNSDKIDEIDNSLYKIFVGGNMLGRGLTIVNLIVTYIYRDSKETAIDTLYQRARWFGYKSNYFDICKVYMTQNLFEKFLATVDNENDMWNMINSFLLTKTNIKEMPRLFKLDNDKLMLTRRTVSKTIVVERVNPGYAYDKSIYYSANELDSNRNLFEEYYSKYASSGKELVFDTSGYQTHFVIETTYTSFFKEFLNIYNFPKGSDFGHLGFTKILDNIKQGITEDKVSIVIMRYKTKQFRALSDKYRIKELPQSYNEGTKYPGDKKLQGLHDKLHFQIHLVYIDENERDKYIPMIAFNNPISNKSIRYVTGDNEYEAS